MKPVMVMQKLLTVSDYGTIRICLKQRMDEKGITRGTLARITGTRYEVIDRWYKGSMEKLDLDVLARICCVLECQVSDLLVYEMEENAGD